MVTYSLYGIVMDIRLLSQKEWECRLSHILKKANFCADFLARKDSA